jgi:hypothetical protein
MAHGMAQLTYPGCDRPPKRPSAIARRERRRAAAANTLACTREARSAALQKLVIVADGLAVFARLAASVTAYMRSLARLRRAAQYSLKSHHSTAAIDRLLRARLREIKDASAYRDMSREFFGAVLGQRFGTSMSIASRRFRRRRAGRKRRNGSGV